MADPEATTILEYATQRSADATLAVTGAQQRLADARTTIAAKRDELAAATAAFTDLEKTAAETRKRLGVIPTPVDGPKLLHDLEQAIIGSRAKQAAILKIGSDLRAAQSDADRAQAELAEALASRAKAESDLLQAEQSDALHTRWKNALTSPPLATINTAAGDPIPAKRFEDAETRIEAELPDTLRDRATARRAAEARRFAEALKSVQTAEDLLLEEREKTGAAGKAESMRVRLLRAEAAAEDFVNNAQSRFDHAQTLLTEVAESSSRLTPEQKEALTDTTLAPARSDAAGAEAVLDGLKNNVEIAQAAFDQVRLDAIVMPDDAAVAAALATLNEAKEAFKAADDVWRAEFEGIANKEALEKDVEDKQQELDELKDDPNSDPADIELAEDALKAALELLRIATAPFHRTLLDAWEAAAPDPAWLLLDDFEKAKAALAGLTASNPPKLVSNLAKAEANYIEALLAADASAGILTQLAAEQARRAARQESALPSEGNSLFSALRGDN